MSRWTCAWGRHSTLLERSGWLVLLGMGLAAAQDNGKPVLLEGPSAIPNPAFVGDSLTLRVKVSDPEGDPLLFSWNFGDGSPSTPYSASPETGHRYQSPGRNAVVVRIRDSVNTLTASFLVAVHLPVMDGHPTASTPILFDSARGRIFCVNPDQGTVTALDSKLLTRLFEFPTGGDPRSLAQDADGAIWVANRGAATVTVHSPWDGTVVSSIRLPYGSRPQGIAFMPNRTQVFVTLEGSGKLARLDPATRSLSGLLDLGPTPHALAISHDGRRILVTRFISPKDHGEIYEVDGPAFMKTRTWILDLDRSPDSETSGSGVPNYLAGIAIAPHGREALVVGKKDNTFRGRTLNGSDLTFENTVRTVVAHLDLAKNAEILESREDIDNGALPSSVLFNPMGDLYFISLLGSNRFQVHDLFNHGSVLERNPGVGAAPMGMALDAHGKRLFVLNFLGRSVSAFDVAGTLENTRFQSLLLKEIPTLQNEALQPDVLAGKRILYNAADSSMSRDGYISCAACHLDGGTDGRVWDFSDRGEGLRRTTSLLGRSGMGHGPVHWSANFDEIQDFEHDMRGPFGGKGFLTDEAFLQGDRNRTLGGNKAGLSNQLDALAAYVKSLARVNSSPYRGANGELTPEAEAGRAIFNRQDVGCAQCHQGAAYTDSRLPVPGSFQPGPAEIFSGAKSHYTREGFLLHDVGTLKPASGLRLQDTLKGLDTPTLKGIWETGPYLHDGSATTLMDVITIANPGDRHGRTSHLSPREREQLAFFLQQLDDGDLPAAGMDPVRSRPLALRMEVLRHSNGSARVRLQAAAGQAAPRVTLRDGKGSLIRVFPARELAAQASGVWIVDWNGMNGSGGRTAPGVLILTGETPGAKTAITLPWTL